MRTLGTLLLLSLLIATGCTTAQTFPTVGEQLAHDVTFSEVAVSIDPSMPPVLLSTFRQFRGTHLLRDAIAARLQAQGRIDPASPYRLEVRVVGLRMKRWIDTLLNGDVEESHDYMTVEVSVIHEEQAALQTSASVASNKGAFFFATGHWRLSYLSRTVAKILTAEI